MTKAKFKNFIITETKLPTKLMMTEDQKDKHIAHLETRLENAKKFFKELRADNAKKDAEITDLKAKLEQQQKAPNNKTDIAESIYNSYPRKVNKKSAIQAINKAIIDMKRNGGTAENLLDTVKQFSQEIARFGINSKHEDWAKVPHPSTWFNQARYENEPAEWTALFREGKYVEPEKVKEVDSEPTYWRKVLKHLYPTSDPSRMLWPHFNVNHPDIAKEVVDNYAFVTKELGL